MVADSTRAPSSAEVTAAKKGTRTERRPRIALLGPFASRNLGDTAIQLAAIEGLRSARPGLEIVGISPEPNDTLHSLAIPAFPLSGRGPASGALEVDFGAKATSKHPLKLDWVRALHRCNAFARSLDLLVISGGGQLDDFWGGPWGHPWSMLQWAALARRHGVPVAFAAVGLDHLSAGLSRRFALAALNMASYVSFRDRQTQRAMQAMGLRRSCVVCPDLAFALPGHNVMARPPARRFVVINPVARSTWSHAADRRHEEYLRKLAEAGEWLASRPLHLRIVCSQRTMDGADALQLQELLAQRGVSDVEICETPTVEDYIASVHGAEIVIAARLHGAILSLVAGSPVIAIAAVPKLQHLMTEVELANFVLPLQTFTAAQLIKQLGAVLAEVETIRRHVGQVRELFRGRLAATFADLVILLG